MYYANENRESLQHQYPSVHYSEVGKILGDKWLELPSPQKEVRLIIPSSSRDISCKKQTTVLMIVNALRTSSRLFSIVQCLSFLFRSLS